MANHNLSKSQLIALAKVRQNEEDRIIEKTAKSQISLLIAILVDYFEFTGDDIKELMIQYENISELINNGQEDIKNIKANIKEVCDIDIDELMKF